MPLRKISVLFSFQCLKVSIEVPSVKWSDIGGQEDAKKSLQEVVESNSNISRTFILPVSWQILYI